MLFQHLWINVTFKPVWKFYLFSRFFLTVFIGIENIVFQSLYLHLVFIDKFYFVFLLLIIICISWFFWFAILLLFWGLFGSKIKVGMGKFYEIEIELKLFLEFY